MNLKHWAAGALEHVAHCIQGEIRTVYDNEQHLWLSQYRRLLATRGESYLVRRGGFVSAVFGPYSFRD